MTEKPVYNMYVLGPYMLTYDASLKTEMFSEKDYHGIIFTNDKGRYQVINNYHMGPRMIVNYHGGGFEDIPFKPASFWCLPPGVTAEELEKESFIHVAFARQ